MLSNAAIEKAFLSKRQFFDSGSTKSYEFRITQLKKLYKNIKKYESDLLDALYMDMHKPENEAYISEIGIIYKEISHTLRYLKEWMKPHQKSSPLVIHPSVSRVYPEPLGVVLIIGPWNYPFFLLIAPLVGAIAAGNCAIIKPSDSTKHTNEVVNKIISASFDPNFVSIVSGPGAMVGPQLIEKYPFNHIFFTGSASVGKQVMALAAKHLTSVTLELGGKSPAIVDKNCNLDSAAKRIVWAKYFNAGQTCISPDYLLVHEDVKDDMILRMKKYIIRFYSDTPENSDHLTYVINDKRFNVLVSYLKDVRILHGGNYDITKRYFSPTIVDNIPDEHPLMAEEIFGPILPVITYKNREEIIPIIHRNRYPLSCYIFTNNRSFEKYILHNVEFGGGCINNTFVQYANPNLPFGGVGKSGIGRYHGKFSFEVFSHYKSVVKTSTLIDPNLKYPPYTKNKLNWVKRLINI